MCFFWCFTPIHIIKYLCDIYVLGLYVFEAIMTILVKMLLHKVNVQVTKHFNMKEEQKTVFLGLTDGESHSHNHE